MMTRQTRNIALQEIQYLDPIGEAELVRGAEHLRQQVIREAFAQFFARPRSRREHAARQFDGAHCVATSTK